MKKRSIFALAAIVLLCTAPAFAAGRAGESGGQQGGQQSNVATVNTVTGSTILANQESKVGIGNVSNEKGKQENVASVNTITGSTILANEKSEVTIGNVTNKQAL